MAQLNDVLDEGRRDGLMFNLSFRNSKDYFSLLQLLRIFKERIREATSELESYAAFSVDEIEAYIRTIQRSQRKFEPQSRISSDLRGIVESAPIVRGNWRYIVLEQEEKASQLSTRIDTKMAEIISLRDGVSLSIFPSIREATC